MNTYLTRLLVVLSLAAFATPREAAIQADKFTDSIGVNIHLSYYDTRYADFDLVLRSLKELGVRHVRDGMVDAGPSLSDQYYVKHNRLGEAGIKCDYITAYNEPTTVIAAYPGRVKDLESIEPPNEYDHSGDPDWVSHLRTYVQTVYGVGHNVIHCPVIGPSFTSWDAYRVFGDQSQYYDFLNLHNYFAGRNPGTPGWGNADDKGHGYGSLPWNVDTARMTGPRLPIYTTETGYTYNIANEKGQMPEEIGGIYMPRLLLEQWMYGIRRTYIYELMDSSRTDTPGGEHFGLLRRDGSQRPAYRAVSNLLRILQDPGPSFTPRDLNYDLGGDTRDVDRLLLQKRGGAFYLALWVEASAWDPNAKVSVNVAPRNTTLKISGGITVRAIYRFQSDGEVSEFQVNNSNLPIAVSDKVIVLKIQ